MVVRKTLNFSSEDNCSTRPSKTGIKSPLLSLKKTEKYSIRLDSTYFFKRKVIIKQIALRKT